MRHVAYALWIGLVSGCGTVTPVPEDVFLRLEAASPRPSTSAPWHPGVLRIAPFRADGLHQERAVIMTADGATLRRHPNYYWLADPPHLLQQQLQRYLRAARIAGKVVTEREPDEALVLRGEIVRFELNTTNLGVLDLELGFSLVEVARDREVFHQDYRVQQPLAEVTSAAVARGMSEAVAKIFADFVADAANHKSTLAKE